MNHPWHNISDTPPLPGERVLRYGQSVFGPYMDIGEVINADGFRWADWGVTHWMRLDAMTQEAYEALPGKAPVFSPEEWWYLCEHQARCACGHLAGLHCYSGDGEGIEGCLIRECYCTEGYANF